MGENNHILRKIKEKLKLRIQNSHPVKIHKYQQIKIREGAKIIGKPLHLREKSTNKIKCKKVVIPKNF
jgi:hypothetical protein